MAAPTDVKAVQRFLGMSGYYRQTIPAYTEKAAPLVALTRKAAPWGWGTEEQDAYKQIKAELTSERTMAHPRIHMLWVPSWHRLTSRASRDPNITCRSNLPPASRSGQQSSTKPTQSFTLYTCSDLTCKGQVHHLHGSQPAQVTVPLRDEELTCAKMGAADQRIRTFHRVPPEQPAS